MIAIFRLVCLQRVAHPGACSNMINIEQLEMVDPRLVELLKIFRRHLIARFDLNLAGSLVDEIIGAVTAKSFLGRDQQVAEPVLGVLVRGPRRNLLPGRETHLPRISDDDVEGWLLSPPRFGADRNLTTAFPPNNSADRRVGKDGF